ncbi:hypothetical protein [Paenibacillus sp. Z6-24]
MRQSHPHPAALPAGSLMNAARAAVLIIRLFAQEFNMEEVTRASPKRALRFAGSALSSAVMIPL